MSWERAPWGEEGGRGGGEGMYAFLGGCHGNKSAMLTHLQYVGAGLEVAERLHDLGVERLNGTLPVSGKSADKQLYSSRIQFQSLSLSSFQERLAVFHK